MSLLTIQSLHSDQKLKLFDRLESLYKNLGQDLKQLPQPCTTCGNCCNFQKAEHRLYVTSLEMAYLLEHAPNFNPHLLEKDICPYQLNHLCSVRNHRMLGCRTFFSKHKAEDRIRFETIHEKYLAKIRIIYKEEQLKWEYKDVISYLKLIKF